MKDEKWVIGITPYCNRKGEQYLPERYQTGIESIHGESRLIRFETPLNALPEIVDHLDGMLFPGGDDVDPALYHAQREPECGTVIPEQDRLELELMRLCLERKLPIFGICRGCQIINVAMGGTLIQHIPKRFGTVHQMSKVTADGFCHDIRVVRGTLLYELMGGDIAVNSYHHQCVDHLGDGLIASAYSPEGFIEAYELPPERQFLLAVQWHPEITRREDVYSQRLYDRFLQAIEEHYSKSSSLTSSRATS